MIMAASDTNFIQTASTASSSITNKVNKNKNEDEVCDNWEQLDYGVLEKRLQTIKLETTNKNEENNVKNNKTMITTTTQNTHPQQQQSIKILKRPPSNKQLNNVSQAPVNLTPAQPIKTFEQREQEYAQARLRILGSAHPEENNSKSSQQQQSHQLSSYTNQETATQSNNTHKSPQKQQTNNVYLIREPVCPDGTKGFNNSTTKTNN